MNLEKILITGASGFLGSALLEELSANKNGKNLVFSLGLKKPTGPSPQNLKHLSCNLEDRADVQKAIKEIQPDRIYHLAGVSQVSHSIAFEAYFKGNFLQTRNLLEALAELKKPIRFLLASSVHVYGNQKGNITEDLPTKVESPYAFTKFLAEESLRQFCREGTQREGLVIRLSSCLGPGQGPGFVAGDFAQKIHLAIRENRSSIKTGPLDTHRQFLDKKDAVRAFTILMSAQLSVPFEIFNLASPRKVTMAELLDEFLKSSGAQLKVESTLPKDNSFKGIEISISKFLKVAHSFTFCPLSESVKAIWNQNQINAS